MIFIKINAILNAAVRNVRRLRFSDDKKNLGDKKVSDDKKISVVKKVSDEKTITVDKKISDEKKISDDKKIPVIKILIKRIQLAGILMAPLLLFYGCSARADEPVLEMIVTEESDAGNDGVFDDTAGTPSGQALSGTEQDIPDPQNTQKAPSSQGTQDTQSALESQGAQGTQTAPSSQGTQDTQSAPESQGAQAAEDISDPQNLLTVHVCGAVRKEGVYSLPVGSRVSDAIEAAGGFSEDADRSYLNLAIVIEDAWQIRVPSKKETETLRTQQGASGEETIPAGSEETRNLFGISTGSDNFFITKGDPSSGDSAAAENSRNESGTEDERINLNTASREELMKIPGVGEKKAQLIIDYRQQHGRFEVIEDLMKVPGIKNASFQKMKDYITV